MVGGPLRHIPDEERARLAELMTRVRAGEVYTGVEGKRLCKDGRLIDGEISAAPIRDASDTVISHLALFADISDRKRQEEELRASRARIVKAGDGRGGGWTNLHDGAQQRLVALSLSLRLAQSKVGSDPSGHAVLESAREELAAALDELRELARGIHPAILTDRGLAAALGLAAGCRSPSRSTRPRSSCLSLSGSRVLVIAEALANVIKYARASVVQVRVSSDETRRPGRVTDDGIGGADAAHGSGLRGLSDRVAALEDAHGRRPARAGHRDRGGDPAGSRPQGSGSRTCGRLPAHPRRIASVGVCCAMNATPKEEVMFADHRIDLAHRRGDGIDVVLWWTPEDDSVAVEVLHLASDSSFELSVERDRALDAFYHPFAYAAHRSPELLDVAA
jgi:PAS domain-containing protein